jgi:hypothetical protein
MTKKAMIELHKEGITPHIQVHDELDISVDNNRGALNQKMYPYEDLMNFSFGTLLVIILLLLLGIF